MASVASYKYENMLREEEVGGEAIKHKGLAVVVTELEVSV